MVKNIKQMKLNVFFLWIYLWAILMVEMCSQNIPSLPVLIGLGLWLGIMLAVVCMAIIKMVSRLEIKKRKYEVSEDEVRRVFLCAFLVAICVFCAYYFASYPGAFSPDSISQYGQVLTGRYSDWHPVLHTLLFFWLPLTVTGGWSGSIVFFQIIWFSLALAYMTATLFRYSNKWAAYISLAFVLMNPSTGRIAMYPWKDTAFAIAVLIMVCIVMHVHFTKGEWLKKLSHVACFIMMSVLATVFRHNAILFTLPMLFAVMLYTGKKVRIQMTAMFLLLLLAVKGPLYLGLDVEKPDNRRSEMLGLPMTVIANVVKHNQGKLDGEMWDYAYRIAPHEVWRNHSTGSFNSIKWDPLTNVDMIDRMGVKKALTMMVKGFQIAPDSAMQGLVALTDMVYAVDAT